MHEQAIMRDLLRRVEEVAESEPGVRVRGVRFWVGALSHLSASQLRDDWPRLTAGTVADGSSVEVEVSGDIHDARAGDVVLVSVRVSSDSDRDGGQTEAAQTGRSFAAADEHRLTGGS